MPYDPNKDEVLKQWRCEETGLMISIQRYAGILMKKDGSERAPLKAGRLTIEDLSWLYDNIDEIKAELSSLVGPS